MNWLWWVVIYIAGMIVTWAFAVARIRWRDRVSSSLMSNPAQDAMAVFIVGLVWPATVAVLIIFLFLSLEDKPHEKEEKKP